MSHKKVVLTPDKPSAEVKEFISLHKKSYQHHTCPRSAVEYMARNNWSLRDGYRDLFSKYYILYWHPEYLMNQITNGQIIHDNEVYNVIYIDRGNPVTYRKSCDQVALSFRLPEEKYNLQGFVLIKGVTEK